MLDPKYVKCFLAQSNPPQTLTASAQRFDCIYPECTQHFLDLMTPCSKQVAQPVCPYFRIQPAHEFRFLGRNPPCAVARIAFLANAAAQCNKRCCPYDTCIRAKRNSLNDIRALPDASTDKDRSAVADAFLSQPVIHCGKSQFYRYPYMVPDDHRGSSCSAPEAVYHYYISSCPDDTAGYSSYIVYCCYLDRYGFLIICGLFYSVYQLR